jgi:outer membrane protein
MKKVIVTLAAVLVLAVALAGCQKKGTPTVAVLDPNKVFTTCEPCVQGGDYLRGLGQSLQQELAGMQGALQGAEGGGGEEAVAKFQARYQEIQQQMIGEQTRIAEKLDKAFQKVMEDYRVKNGVAVILNKENVLSFDGTVDATEAVIAALNATAIDLEIPAAPAAGEPAAPAQDAPAEQPEGGKKSE